MQLIWYLPSLVIGLGVGFTSGYWQLALVSALMFTVMIGASILKNRYPIFDSASNVFVSAGQVAIDSRVLPAFEFLWKKQWHQLLLKNHARDAAPDFLGGVLTRLDEAGFFLSPSARLRIWIGATTERELELNLGSESAHLIIVGPTGSGKSELLKLLVHSLLEDGLCDLVLFDFKGGATLEPFQDCALGLATDLDSNSQQRLWDQVAGELATREQLFAQQKVSTLEQFNAVHQPLPEVVVVVDEFSAALASGPKAVACLEDVTARGRSLGVHLIGATQSLTGIPRSMLTNIRARIAMKSSDPIDLVQLGINPNKIELVGVPGWASAFSIRGNNPAEGFYFPLGFSPKQKPAALIPTGEPPLPARSQLLRQMYSSQEPATDPARELPSNQDSQLLSRMEGLRWLEHR
jgi:type II secretory pathway predicted ATPase ExeA